MDFGIIPKYFIHGIAFAILMLVLILAWVFILAMLVAIGLFIGLLIGFVAIFFFIGGLNSVLTNIIWGIKTETAWKSLLAQGFILFVLLTIVHIPSIVIDYGVPGPATTIGLFVVNAIIDGLVAKNVAGWWKEYKCIQCGRQFPKYARECPFCGTVQTSVVSGHQETKRAELPKICPKCGKETWLNFKTCPRCGEYLPDQDANGQSM